MEGGLDAQVIYDPPNLTYPYGAYIAVVDIDPTPPGSPSGASSRSTTAACINPMVVDGQIHGGLAEGIGTLMEVITFDEEGNCLNSSFMDYLIPTALECPDFELGETVTPCPHHPLGAKGVGESPNVGSPPAIVNAVIDALHETHGVDHIDMPCTPARVWAAMQDGPSRPRPSAPCRRGRRSSQRRARRSWSPRSFARSARRVESGRCRARARGRHDRASGRRVHAGRARVLPAGDRERRGAVAANTFPTDRPARTTASVALPTRRERRRSRTRACPVARSRCSSSRCSPRRASSSSATRRSGRCDRRPELAGRHRGGERVPSRRSAISRCRGVARPRRAVTPSPRARDRRSVCRPRGQPKARCGCSPSSRGALDRIDVPAGIDIGARRRPRSRSILRRDGSAGKHTAASTPLVHPRPDPA